MAMRPHADRVRDLGSATDDSSRRLVHSDAWRRKIVGWAKRLILSIQVFLFWATVVGAAQPLPKVDFVYPSPYGSMIDRLCSNLLKTQIEPKWIQETLQRLPEFQALWEKDGTAYLSVALREVGLDYPFREVQATLTVCPGVPSMGSPLMIQVRPFLSSDEKPKPASLFPLYVFHELMHRYTTPVHAVSPLRKKYASEPLITLNLLHIMALEKLVLVKLGKSEELRELDEIYRTERTPMHKRAWEIVNEKESYEAFVNELKLLRK
jgi:hypothetical protein